MASNEVEIQLPQDPQLDEMRNASGDEASIPTHKSSVRNDPSAAMQTTKYEKGDIVHMSVISNGVRRKGVYQIHSIRINKTNPEYQLLDNGTMYKDGEWIREKELRMDKGASSGK